MKALGYGWLAGVGVLLTALHAPLVHADQADQARFHDERARAAFSKRRFEAALEEFFLSQRLAPNPRTDYNVALCFELLGRDDDAYMYFDGFLSDAASRESELAELRSHAERSLVQLESRVARVQVSSTPPGARIYVDKKEHGSYGVTPRTLALSAGEHHIWVELSGYRPAAQTVQAVRGERVELPLSPARIQGKLTIESAVQGSVKVLDADRAVVAEGTTPYNAELPPGAYELDFASPRHLPWRGLVNVRPDTTVSQRIVPEPRPGPTGDLTVTSNVAGAVLELDGRLVGFAPTVLPRLSAGVHRLSLSSEGVVPWKGSVVIRENERAWVTVDLDEPPVTSRSPLTWASGGIGAASLLSGIVMAVLAAQRHAGFSDADEVEKAQLMRDGRTENLAADVLISSGVAFLATSTYLFFATATQRGGLSTATVARDQR